MRVKRLIKDFTWTEEDRNAVDIGEGTRINPEAHCATLKEDADGLYSTEADLYIKSRLTNPQSVRRWLGFDANVVHFFNDDGTPFTSVQFRLDDGVREFYWDGATWAAADPDNWNSEQELADHMVDFLISSHTRTLRIVVNLKTTNPRFTPILREVRVLFEAVIEFQEDIIYRSMIPALKAAIRPISQVVVPMPETGTTLNKTLFKLETGYNIAGIDAVFDFTGNNQQARDGIAPNLLQGYNSGTGVITLTESVDIDTPLWIRFTYVPEVVVTTSQDYISPERIPALVLSAPALRDTRDAPDSGKNWVVNKALRSAVVVPAPQQGDLEITMLGITDKAVDQQRLQEQVNAFFANHPLLISTGLDEQYRLQLIDEYAAVGEPGQEDNHVGKALFQIRNFKRWLRDAYDEQIVTSKPQLLTSWK